MPSQILTTKLYIPPPRPNLVLRPRLLDHLRAGAAGKLTLTSAPAGYGKSTLLSEWISQGEMPFGWLSLDRQDNELNRFLAYVAASLGSIPVKIDDQISASLETPQSDIYETFLIPLLNQISMHEGAFGLVLDDYHLIHNQEIHQAVNYVLDNLPPGMHLVVATRTDPPLRLAQLRALGELCEIRAENLRFTSQESLTFLNQCMGLDLSVPDVTTLSQKTEGWIVGLQLAAISLQGQQDKQASIRVFAGDDRYIADYLLDEVLDRLPPHIHTFLLQTSILDRLCASLCNATTGRSDSQAILAELEQANLFLTSLDSQRHWFRYHHLFADLLKNRLHQTLADEVLTYHHKASAWYQANGLFPDAVNHALDANDIDQIVQLTEEMAVYNMNYRESTALLAWLERLPEPAFQQHPWLLVAHTWANLNNGKYELVEASLVEIDSILLDGSLPNEQAARIQGHAAAIRSYLAEIRADLGSAIQNAEESLALLPEQDVKLRSFTAIRLANCQAWFGDFEKAIRLYKTAGENSKLVGDGQAAITALSEMAVIQMIAGKLHQAVKSISTINEYAEKLTQQFGRRPITMGILYRHMSTIKHELNELSEAAYYAKEAVEICERWGDKEALFISLIALAREQHSLGNFQQAEFHFQRSEQIASQISPKMASMARIYSIQYQLLQGKVKQAEIWTRKRGLSTADEISFELRNDYPNFARLLYVQKYYQQALDVVRKLLQVTASVGAVSFTIGIRVFQAMILYKLKAPDQAMAAIESALSMASTEGYVRSILDEGEEVSALLYQAAQQGIYPEYCQKLLGEINKSAINASRTTQGEYQESSGGLVETVSDREIEVLELIAQGCTNQEIAQELILSLYTIKSHARNIYSKLGVKNRTEAVTRARQLGLLPQD